MAKNSSKGRKKSKKNNNLDPISLIIRHIDWYLSTWCEMSQPDSVSFDTYEIYRICGYKLEELSDSQTSDLYNQLNLMRIDAYISRWDGLVINGWIRK